MDNASAGPFVSALTKALDKVKVLKNLYSPPKDLTPRTGDYYLLFNCFSHPSLASELFFLLEKARVIGHLLRHYPGLKRHIDHFFDHTAEVTVLRKILSKTPKVICKDTLVIVSGN